MTNKTSNIENNKEIQIESKIKKEADSNLAKSNEIIADNLNYLVEIAKKYQTPQTVHDYFSSLHTYRLIIESTMVL
jgi:DNA-directed RNA polymerase sigma subunit (sigma70/sigma32)